MYKGIEWHKISINTRNWKITFPLYLGSPDVTLEMQVNGQTQSAPPGIRTQNLKEVCWGITFVEQDIRDFI